MTSKLYKRTNRVRLLIRGARCDARGDHAGYEHGTVVAEIPADHVIVTRDLKPEVIGGEWLYDIEESEETKP